MDDLGFQHALRQKMSAEFIAGASWVLRELSARAQQHPGDSPEWLELLRAKNAIQGRLGARLRELDAQYIERGF